MSLNSPGEMSLLWRSLYVCAKRSILKDYLTFRNRIPSIWKILVGPSNARLFSRLQPPSSKTCGLHSSNKLVAVTLSSRSILEPAEHSTQCRRCRKFT